MELGEPRVAFGSLLDASQNHQWSFVEKKSEHDCWRRATSLHDVLRDLQDVRPDSVYQRLSTPALMTSQSNEWSRVTLYVNQTQDQRPECEQAAQEQRRDSSDQTTCDQQLQARPMNCFGKICWAITKSFTKLDTILIAFASIYQWDQWQNRIMEEESCEDWKWDESNWPASLFSLRRFGPSDDTWFSTGVHIWKQQSGLQHQLMSNS